MRWQSAGRRKRNVSGVTWSEYWGGSSLTSTIGFFIQKSIITCFPGCLCIMAQESGAVKSEKSVEPRPGRRDSFVNFCDSNVSLEMSRMKGRISYTSSRIAIVSSDSQAPRILMVAQTKYFFWWLSRWCGCSLNVMESSWRNPRMEVNPFLSAVYSCPRCLWSRSSNLVEEMQVNNQATG